LLFNAESGRKRTVFTLGEDIGATFLRDFYSYPGKAKVTLTCGIAACSKYWDAQLKTLAAHLLELNIAGDESKEKMFSVRFFIAR
jgi:hypothetical protein